MKLSVIRKEKGEWCVRSPDNPDWNGGCYAKKEDAEDRLKQVEFFKHQKSARNVVMAFRVARRFVAGLGDQLEAKMRDLLDGPLEASKSTDLADWLETNFFFQGSKTPKGQKGLKDDVNRLHWWLKNGIRQHQDPEKLRPTLEDAWARVKAHIDDFVKNFSEEGGKKVPKEIQVGGNTYINVSGFSEAQLQTYAKSLEQVFDELKGWRKKALGGGVKIALAGPREFHGTVGGKYKSGEDTLYVRATPQVFKRSRGTYGAFDYIIIHELGHRYERKHSVPIDFDRQEWWTSKYSRNEGESFAELFALSNFDIKGQGDPAILDRFEAVMAGRDDPAKPELPPHLQKAVQDYERRQRL